MNLLYRVALAVALVTGVSYFSDGHAKPQDAEFNHIDPPDEKGPYNVGIRTFENVLMSAGRLTRIQIFYPAEGQRSSNSNCPNTYTISVFGGTYKRSSPLCALQDATVASGPFPMVVFDHGGAPAGSDRLRIEHLPDHETLASHGFVVVVALHAANRVAQVRDLSLVIDYMLGRNSTPGDPLVGRIDPDRIGISGGSAGGLNARRLAGGWANPGPGIPGIAADPRIKAMVLYEPEPDDATLATDASNISVPYLIMGGDRFSSGVFSSGSGGLAIPALFDATVLATPRIYVLNPEALHLAQFTDLCSLIDETREAALLADPTLLEPLTNMITVANPDPITGLPTRRVCTAAANINIDPGITDPTIKANIRAAASEACFFWNRGETQSPITGFGFGGGRNICTRVGVNSSRSLDTTPVDGFTDSPPFLANDAWNSDASTVEPPMPGEILVPMVKLYTIAFWKKFLEGDGRYMRYLTPGYANVHNLESVVEIQE